MRRGVRVSASAKAPRVKKAGAAQNERAQQAPAVERNVCGRVVRRRRRRNRFHFSELNAIEYGLAPLLRDEVRADLGRSSWRLPFIPFWHAFLPCGWRVRVSDVKVGPVRCDGVPDPGAGAAPIISELKRPPGFSVPFSHFAAPGSDGEAQPAKLNELFKALEGCSFSSILRFRDSSRMKDAAPSPTPRSRRSFSRPWRSPTGEVRAAYLDRACADDPLLRRWVERELRKQTAGLSHLSFPHRRRRHRVVNRAADLQAQPGDGGAPRATEAREEPGDRIGPSTSCSRKCSVKAASGTVWLAQQEKPVRREVALKLLESRDGFPSSHRPLSGAGAAGALRSWIIPASRKSSMPGATETGRPLLL